MNSSTVPTLVATVCLLVAGCSGLSPAPETATHTPAPVPTTAPTDVPTTSASTPTPTATPKPTPAVTGDLPGLPRLEVTAAGDVCFRVVFLDASSGNETAFDRTYRPETRTEFAIDDELNSTNYYVVVYVDGDRAWTHSLGSPEMIRVKIRENGTVRMTAWYTV